MTGRSIKKTRQGHLFKYLIAEFKCTKRDPVEQVLWL